MSQIPNQLNTDGSLHNVIVINGVGLKKGVKKKLCIKLTLVHKALSRRRPRCLQRRGAGDGLAAGPLRRRGEQTWLPGAPRPVGALELGRPRRSRYLHLQHRQHHQYQQILKVLKKKFQENIKQRFLTNKSATRV